MKKYLTLGILTFLFVFIFTGCGTKCSYKESQFDTIVIKCEEGSYHPNSSYIALANSSLAQKNFGMYSTYMSLANANGKYDYHITISIDGDNFTVIRESPYEVGQHILITRLDTYQNSQIIQTEYK